MLTHSEDHETETHDTPRSAILELSAGHEQTIYVNAFHDTGARIPAFAASADGPFFTEGFSWKFADAPLRVTFVFGSEIAGIRTSHHALACAPCHHGTQEMVIPASAAKYNFDVEFAGGELHDPVIIVSPGGN